MAPKGLSLDEKRTRMLALFLENSEVFSLKELEKIAPKQKGIVAQSVKDVVTRLVADGLVNTDKIGSGVYFWAFKSQRAVAIKNAHESRTKERQTLLNTKADLEKELAIASEGKEHTEDRRNYLALLEAEQQQQMALQDQLAKFSDADPAQFEKKNNDIKVLRDAAIFWTDGVGALVSYARDKTGLSSDELRTQLDISETFDDLEWPSLILESPQKIVATDVREQMDVPRPSLIPQPATEIPLDEQPQMTPQTPQDEQDNFGDEMLAE